MVKNIRNHTRRQVLEEEPLTVEGCSWRESDFSLVVTTAGVAVP